MPAPITYQVDGPRVSEPFTLTVYPNGPGLHTIDQFARDGAISGVYHPATHSMASVPSGHTTFMADGTAPPNLGPRNGAHIYAEDILLDRVPGYREGDGLGFTVYTENAAFAMTISWRSVGVNGNNPSFPGPYVPPHLRSEIVAAVDVVIDPSLIARQRER